MRRFIGNLLSLSARGSKAAPSEPLDDNLIVEGFRWILGREPESPAVVMLHRRLRDRLGLRAALIASPEFTAANKLVRFDEKWVMTEVYGGRYRMWVDLGDHFVSFGCLLDNYEPEETAFIRANVRKGMHVLDIGANIGWHTLGLADAVGPEGSVVAFEPRPVTADRLADTLVVNGLSERVRLVRNGLWDKTATLRLSWVAGTRNPGGSSLTANKAANGTDVELVRLDDVVEEPIDFIKMDVEGAEPKVVAGGQRLLAKSRPLILSELHPDALTRVSGVPAQAYIRTMAELGYQCRLLGKQRRGELLLDFPQDIGRDIVNVAFVPAGAQARLQ